MLILRALLRTRGGGQVGVASSWLTSRCPPPTSGSQFRAMSAPPGGFSAGLVGGDGTWEPSGRGYTVVRATFWDAELPLYGDWRGVVFMPGFRHEGTDWVTQSLGTAWRAGSSQNSLLSPPTPPISWKARDLGNTLCPVFGSEDDISVSLGSVLVVRTPTTLGSPPWASL